MFPTIDPAELADCVVPLDEEGRRALRRYWERVIRGRSGCRRGSGRRRRRGHPRTANVDCAAPAGPWLVPPRPGRRS